MFVPKRVYFDLDSLDYPLGQELYKKFIKMDGVEVDKVKSPRLVNQRGLGAPQKYKEAKKTIFVTVRKTLQFQTCKPSAHYQLPLVSSCPGLCEYCYLQTTLGKTPLIKVYVNIEEILAKAKEYIDKRKEITVFEGAATSDPLPVEDYTGVLRRTIEFFAKEPKGRFRFVTKYANVQSLLDLEHNNHTTFRFSLNTEKVIKEYEKGTANLAARIKGANLVSKSGYPMGFIIAPILIYPNWQQDYLSLLENLQKNLEEVPSLTFELITHRFTTRAKNNILEVFPKTTLPLDEGERKLKYGQFGYTKYVYPKEIYDDVESFFRSNIEKLFPKSEILYLV
ncbi:spore photoproduct lyase [Anaerobranca gottschalkii]|uniref:Spore photoproduct lyase n=1 Tax=Anaerobranca gottschalkii DSM 13577 TaxID=1120990 RepID=A0A1I0AAN2_9FIRM|nr:spore photoproduct lyase [Anaerobranca gottschalkii]SES90316.1 spore photoproduct lyase [Anaerobranca gottschalkii DSM 13577]